jgi:hypothetical protein
MASFAIEGFGLERFKTLRPAEVETRLRDFRRLVAF